MKHAIYLTIIAALLISGCIDTDLEVAPTTRLVGLGCTEVDLALLPAVNADDFSESFNETKYKVFRNGAYIGEFDAIEYGFINESDLNESNNSTQRRLFVVFDPNDKIELLVTAWNTTERIKLDSLNCPVEYVTPKINIPSKYDFGYKIEPDDYTLRYFLSRNDENEWTYNTTIPEIKLDFDLNQNKQRPVYQHICCDYGKYDIEYFRLNNKYFEDLKEDYSDSCNYGDFYNLDGNLLEMFIVLDELFFLEKNSTKIYCSFIDSAYFMTKSGIIEYSENRENGIDVGRPNRGFNLTINWRQT